MAPSTVFLALSHNFPDNASAQSCDILCERLFLIASLNLLSLREETTEITVGRGKAFGLRITSYYQAGKNQNRKELLSSDIIPHFNKGNSIARSMLCVVIYVLE